MSGTGFMERWELQKCRRCGHQVPFVVPYLWQNGQWCIMGQPYPPNHPSHLSILFPAVLFTLQWKTDLAPAQSSKENLHGKKINKCKMTQKKSNDVSRNLNRIWKGKLCQNQLGMALVSEIVNLRSLHKKYLYQLCGQTQTCSNVHAVCAILRRMWRATKLVHFVIFYHLHKLALGNMICNQWSYIRCT